MNPLQFIQIWHFGSFLALFDDMYLTIDDFFFQTSDPSETIVAWTDPIVPAFAEPPAGKSVIDIIFEKFIFQRI